MRENMISMLKNVGVEVEDAVRRFSGNEALYEKFLGRFLKDDTYEKVQKAFAEGNKEEALAAAHTLKGVSANLGLSGLFKICSEMVVRIREDDYEGAARLTGELAQAYGEICGVLNQIGEGQE